MSATLREKQRKQRTHKAIAFNKLNKISQHPTQTLDSFPFFLSLYLFLSFSHTRSTRAQMLNSRRRILWSFARICIIRRQSAWNTNSSARSNMIPSGWTVSKLPPPLPSLSIAPTLSFSLRLLSRSWRAAALDKIEKRILWCVTNDFAHESLLFALRIPTHTHTHKHTHIGIYVYVCVRVCVLIPVMSSLQLSRLGYPIM